VTGVLARFFFEEVMQISAFLVESYESDRDLAVGAEDRQDKSLRWQAIWKFRP